MIDSDQMAADVAVLSATSPTTLADIAHVLCADVPDARIEDSTSYHAAWIEGRRFIEIRVNSFSAGQLTETRPSRFTFTPNGVIPYRDLAPVVYALNGLGVRIEEPS